MKRHAPYVHLVEYFIAAVGRTRCGIFSERISAYHREVTCPRCRKRRR